MSATPQLILRILIPALLLIAIFVLAGMVLTGNQQSHPNRSYAPFTRVSQSKRAPLDARSIDKSRTRILIKKSEYQLHLYLGDSLLRTYLAVFGPAPEGDKFREGDGRTPEGDFKIRSMYDHEQWSKFIWIDYPNEESWQRFNRRQAQGAIPTSARIGGEIGIHGVPAGYDHAIAERQNWTLGCISLTTSDIRELYSVVQVGTEIEILP